MKVKGLIWIYVAIVLLIAVGGIFALNHFSVEYSLYSILAVPLFFLLIIFIFWKSVKKIATTKKELSVAKILGIRSFMIFFILIALIVHIVIDRQHVLQLAISYILFTMLFSVFETKILLLLNNK
jgi:hypothetical protein